MESGKLLTIESTVIIHSTQEDNAMWREGVSVLIIPVVA